MNVVEARRLITAALGEVAPELDATQIDAERDLTEQLDLDSMDYLEWLLAIHRATGVDIPERDYARLLTIAGAAQYLAAASSSSGTRYAL